MLLWQLLPEKGIPATYPKKDQVLHQVEIMYMLKTSTTKDPRHLTGHTTLF